MSGNQELFDGLTFEAHQWARRFGTRRPETYAELLPVLVEAASALGASAYQSNYLTMKIATFWATVVGRGIIITPKGPVRGKGMWPETPAELKRRYSATELRQWLFEQTIPYIEMRHEVETEKAARGEETHEKHEAGRGPGGMLSIRQLHDLVIEHGSTPSRKAVETVRARQHGMPRREAKIAGLTRPSRDLLTVLEELPKGKASLVCPDSVTAKLWECTRPKAMFKLREHVAEIQAAKVGVNLMLTTDGLIVGRGVGILRKLYAAKGGDMKVRRLSPGLLPSRQGLWSTTEGDMALDLVEHLHLRDERAFLHGVARLTSSHTYDEGEEMKEAIGVNLRLANSTMACAEQRTLAKDKATALHVQIKDDLANEAFGMERILEGFAEGRLAGAWQAAASLRFLRIRAAHDPAVARRVARIGKALERCHDRDDVLSLVMHMAIRKSRRGVWIAPSDTRPTQRVHPKPLPKFDHDRLRRRIAGSARRAAEATQWAGIPDFLRPNPHALRRPMPPPSSTFIMRL